MSWKIIIAFLLAIACLGLESKKWIPVDSVVAGLAKVINNNAKTATTTFNLPDEFQSSNAQYLAAANSMSIYYYDFFCLQVSINLIASKQFEITFMMNSTSATTRAYFYASYLFIDKNKISSGLKIFQNDYSISSGLSSIIRNFTYDVTYGTEAEIATFICKISATGYLRHMHIGTVIQIDGSYNLKVIVTIGVDTTVNSVGIYYLAVGKTVLYSQYQIRVDNGYFAGNMASGVTGISLGSFKTDDYIVGINGYHAFTSDVAPSIKTAYFQFIDSSLINQEGQIYFVNMTCLNFRIWSCPKTSPYFIKNSTSDCTDSCAAGYFGDNSTWNCEKCHYSCATCTKNSTNEACDSCDSNNKRTISGKKCLCNSGFYDNGQDALCASCISNCSVCTDSTSCQTCSTATFTVTLFGDSVSLSLIKNAQNQCIICSEKITNCIECTDNAICTKCYKDNDIWKVKADSSGCECNNANQYFPKSTSECQKCSTLIAGCLTCSNNQTCATCDDANNFTLSGSSCICKTGLTLKNYQCQLCHFSCLTCQGDTTNCTSCESTLKRVSTPVNNQCSCLPTFYQANIALCSPCLKVCATCNAASTCLTCTINTNLTLNVDKCECISNKYTLINNDHCELCSSKITYCDTCTDYQNCTLCKYSNYTLSANKKSCICDTSNQYFLNSSGSTCIKCSDLIIGCLTCSDKNTCQTCDPSNNLVLSNSVCKCQVGYFFDGSLCKPCHFSCLQCQTTATKCTACSSSNKRITLPNSNNQCLCIDKFYQNSVASCPACLKVCATCSSGNTCLTCTLNTNLALNNNNCTCISNKYALISQQYCQLCSIRIDNCATCSNNQTCTTCINQNYTVSSTYKCQCSISNQYFLNGTLSFCIKCVDVIANCQTCDRQSGTLAVICQTCISNFTTIPTKKLCECDTLNNFFPLGIICPHCTDLIRGCINCTSTTKCNLCFMPNNTMGSNNLTCDCDTLSEYHTWGAKCVLCSDLILGCLNCSNNSTCTICNQAGFFRLQQTYCVCKDGYYLDGNACLPCDVSCLTCVNKADYCLTCNQTALRTFVENRCNCFTHFSDCRYSGIDQCENHTCSFLNPVEIIISSMIKDPEQNKLTFQITFSPTFQEYDFFNFTSLLNIGFPQSSNIEYSYNNGTMTVIVNYYQNLQGQQTKMEFSINQTQYWYFKLTPYSSLNYSISPTNNLAANLYSQSIYDKQKTLSIASIVVSALGIVVYLLGLISSKIIVSEMIAVSQIAYLGLFIVQYGDPLFYSLNNLQYSNGLNNLVPAALQQNSPSRVFYSGHASSVVFNLNLMLSLILIPPLVSFIIYVIHKNSTEYRIIMQKYWKLILAEGSMTLFIFLLYNYSSSLTGFCLYTKVFNTQFYLSILEILILSALFGVLLYMFWIKDRVWMGQFKNNFNWNYFCQKYYFIPIIQRFLIGIILTAGNMHFVSAIIVNCFLIASIVILFVKKPFVYKYQNYRSILTNIYAMAIVSIYLAYRINGPSKGQSLYMYFPYFIIGILAVNIATAIIFIIISFVNKTKFKKVQKQCRGEEQAEQEMHQDINRKIQQMIKQAKTNNINNRLINKGNKMNKKQKQTIPATPTAAQLGINNYKALWDNIPKINNPKEEYN